MSILYLFETKSESDDIRKIAILSKTFSDDLDKLKTGDLTNAFSFNKGIFENIESKKTINIDVSVFNIIDKKIKADDYIKVVHSGERYIFMINHDEYIIAKTREKIPFIIIYSYIYIRY